MFVVRLILLEPTVRSAELVEGSTVKDPGPIHPMICWMPIRLLSWGQTLAVLNRFTTCNILPLAGTLSLSPFYYSNGLPRFPVWFEFWPSIQGQYAAALARYRWRPYTVCRPVYSRNLCGLQVSSFSPLLAVPHLCCHILNGCAYLSVAAGRGPLLQPDTSRITATAVTGSILVADLQLTTTPPVTMPDCNSRQLKDESIRKASYCLLITEGMMVWWITRCPCQVCFYFFI